MFDNGKLVFCATLAVIALVVLAISVIKKGNSDDSVACVIFSIMLLTVLAIGGLIYVILPNSS